MECPDCDGRGCGSCGGAGRFEITGCPKKRVPDCVYDLIEMEGYRDQGLLPVDGGVLDQAAVFMRASDLLRREERYWKAKLGIKD